MSAGSGITTRASSYGWRTPSRSTTPSRAHEGSANGHAGVPNRLPQPGTEHDPSGSSRLPPVVNGDIYVPHLNMRPSPWYFTGPRCRLEWAGASPRWRYLGGLPFASFDFLDFRAHGLPVRVGDLLVSFGEIRRSCFCLRHATSTAILTAEAFLTAADTAFVTGFAIRSLRW